jgi:hypothetical protein
MWFMEIMDLMVSGAVGSLFERRLRSFSEVWRRRCSSDR